jgi:hypothetical protein
VESNHHLEFVTLRLPLYPLSYDPPISSGTLTTPPLSGELRRASMLRLALSFSRVVISPRLSRASKDGCSTQKDVHLATDP